VPDVGGYPDGDVRAVLAGGLVPVEEDLMDLAAGVTVRVGIMGATVQQRRAFVSSLGETVSGRFGRVVLRGC
jgi:hypothetical protein